MSLDFSTANLLRTALLLHIVLTAVSVPITLWLAARAVNAYEKRNKRTD